MRSAAQNQKKNGPLLQVVLLASCGSTTVEKAIHYPKTINTMQGNAYIYLVTRVYAKREY